MASSNHSIPQCADLCLSFSPTSFISSNGTEVIDPVNYSEIFNTSCELSGSVQASCEAACLDPRFLFLSDMSILWCNEIAYIREPCNLNYINQMIGIANSCLQQYCQFPDPNLGGCPLTHFSNMSSDDTCNQVTSIGPMELMLQSTQICGNLLKSVNSDLGGAGIYIAYLMQLSLFTLAVVFFLATGPLKITEPIMSLLAHLDHFAAEFKTEERERKLQTRVEKLLDSKRAIVTSLSVDLQETQCFFMLASVTAIWIVLKRQELGGSFGATNYYQLQNNYEFVIVIELIGVIASGGINWLLMVSDNWSSYIAAIGFITSFISLVTCIQTYVRLIGIDWDGSFGSGLPLLYSGQNTNLLDQCGYNPPPLVYCLPGGATGSDKIQTMSTAMLVGVGVLWLVSCFWATIYLSVSKVHSWLDKTRPSDDSRSSHSKQPADFPPGPLAFLVWIGYLGAIGMAFYCLVFLNRSGAVAVNDWSIGQVVSIWALVPVAVKAIYSLSTDIMKYFNSRIPAPYAIVNTDEVEIIDQHLGHDEESHHGTEDYDGGFEQAAGPNREDIQRKRRYSI
ncbi:hypothetical protein N431DRAFT_558412 [Stipitochalara longipes BDJ]|nr:hypothetical protein N431DRAFT_558412 [Stipitochalara longipes BDJ]